MLTPILLTALAVYLLLQAVRFGSIFYGVWSQALAPIRFVVEEQFPEELKPAFAGVLAEYARLGFAPVHYFAVYNIMGVRDWTILLENAPAASFSTLNLSTVPDARDPFSPVFYTFLNDGKLLATFNGVAYSIAGDLPETILQDGYLTSVEEQWRLHQGVLRDLASAVHPVPLSWQDFAQRLSAHYDAYVDSLFATKQAVRGKEQGEFYLTAGAVWKLAMKVFAGARKKAALHRKLLASQRANEIAPLALPVPYEVESFQSFDGRKRRPVPVSTRLAGLAISLVLFALSFSLLLDFRTVLALIGVLALHEAGHLAAMKLVGYQNLSYLFLPFLGAAVSGQKEDATLGETMLVLFAGPLPGLVLGVVAAFGLALAGVDYPRQLLTWISLLIFLNYLNLLPLFPLDGGRILDRLLFAHNPYAGAWFKAFAAGVVLLAWWSSRDFILLAFGIILAVSARSNFSQAKGITQVMKRLPDTLPDGEREALTTIYQAMENAGQAAEPFHRKYLLVKAVQGRRYHAGDRLSVRMAFLGLYLACLLGGMLLWISLTILRSF